MITKSNYKYIYTLTILFFISLLTMPNTSNAGEEIICPPFCSGKATTATDTTNPVLIGYWDLRERNSYFQVTNTSSEDIRMHIQIFDASNNCVEFDYFDTFTPRDTHVYDVSSLDRNNGVTLSSPILSGGHGIVAITHVSTTNDFFNPDSVLTGNFRIIDNDGYEYRTNLAGVKHSFIEDIIGPETGYFNHKIHFNAVDDSTFADLAVIGFNFIPEPTAGIELFVEEYNITLYDEDENPISCPPVVLGCLEEAEFLPVAQNGDALINVGINQAITNSRGGPSLCLGTDTTGFLEIDKSFEVVPGRNLSQNSLISPEILPGYVIFMGLNNGSGGTGSMDTAIGSEEFLFFPF